MATTSGDLRYAVRSLRANPGFTAVAVASLALGIGVNAAIFSLVEQLLLWSIPARDPGQLVGIEGGRSRAYPFYVEYRDRNQVFSGMFACSQLTLSGVRPEGAPAVELGQVNYVTGAYFKTLGVGAAAGRVIAEEDDQKVGGSPVAVLSYSYWQRRFGGDLSVLGRKLTVNGYPLEIAGIAEKGFGGLFPGRQADLFVPVTLYPLTTPAAAQAWNTPNMHWLMTLGRLKPGVSLEQAQAAMRVLWPQAMEAVNDAAEKRGGRRRQYKEEQISLIPARHGFTGGRNAEMMDPLKTLVFATGLVLLIASANVANLLLARASGRQREIAIRLAVGATRARLIRQLLSESLVLAAIGGGAGVALAYGGVWAMAKTNIVDPALRFQLSVTMMVFSAGVTLLAAVLFGLAPAFRATKLGLSEAMQEGGRSSQSGARFRLGKVLVAGQVALSLALLAGAGLFIRTLRNLESVDIGFERENILIVDVDPTSYGYRGHRLRGFYEELLQRTRRIPGVRSAGLASMTPMGEYSRSRTFSAEGYVPAPDERLVAYSNPVSPDYFRTLGIPMLLGRDFRPQDEPGMTPADSFLAQLGRTSGGSNEPSLNSSQVCIINESLARRLFSGLSPVGRHLSYEDKYAAGRALEIVGVVKDVRHSSVRESDNIGVIYVPAWSDGAEARWLGVRVAGNAAPVAAAIRSELHEMDPNVPVLHTRSLEEYVNTSLQRERLIAYLAGFFGLLALALASVGLYGVMAHAVTKRIKEIGIRMAFGAERRDVVGMILRDSMIPVGAGMAVGAAATLALARVVARMLYGVAPLDPASIVVAAGCMLAVALLAAAIPVRRASRVDPVTSLRHE